MRIKLNDNPLIAGVGEKRANVYFETHLSKSSGKQKFVFHMAHFVEQEFSGCVINHEDLFDKSQLYYEICDMPRKNQKRIDKMEAALESKKESLFEAFVAGDKDKLVEIIESCVY